MSGYSLFSNLDIMGRIQKLEAMAKKKIKH